MDSHLSYVLTAVDDIPEEIGKINLRSIWCRLRALSFYPRASLENDVDNAELLEVKSTLYHMLFSDLCSQLSLASVLVQCTGQCTPD